MATFGFLRFALLGATIFGLLAGYVAHRPPTALYDYDLPPALMELAPPIQSSPPPIPLPAVSTPRPAREARGVALAPQDLTGAALANCRLVGDWRSCSLRGVRLSECDLSGADLATIPMYGRAFARQRLRFRHADLSDCSYDRSTRWPTGFDHYTDQIQ